MRSGSSRSELRRTSLLTNNTPDNCTRIPTNSVGYPCPDKFNPADHYVHVLAITPGDEDTCRKRVGEICQQFEQSDWGELCLLHRTLALPTNCSLIPSRPRDGARSLLPNDSQARRATLEERVSQEVSVQGLLAAAVQGTPLEGLALRHQGPTNCQGQRGADHCKTLTLFVRVVRGTARDSVRLYIQIISIMLGIVFLQQGPPYSQLGAQNIAGAIFIILTNITFANQFAVINVSRESLNMAQMC